MERLWLNNFTQYLKPRSKNWHKGDSGYVLVIGGDQSFLGAPRMAAEAALRVGAGLAVVATHPDHAAMLSATCPEIISHGIKKVTQLSELSKKANVIILGPGLGQSDWSKKMLSAALKFKSVVPMIIDADALNLIAKRSSHKKESHKANIVITPHPAEAARLLKITTHDVQNDREKAVRILQNNYGGTSVLKGSGTLVCTGGQDISICDVGNPGMATAGMGDVLSGVIGGLVAQGVSVEDSAKMGVLIHAMAGDLAAADGGERGMMATDLMPYLRQLMNSQ